ncbi:MAG TPA: YdiU family protein [Mesorhizobium sp.]|jgi:uncharacterized protein YdiU (UPF0061 family)|nr:YdiU family protein [Mesorhizobium sp.]
MTLHFPFDNSYVRLPERFFAAVLPTRVAAPKLIKLNGKLAEELGLNPGELEGPEGAEIFSGNRLPEEAQPIALAYAGHQFGQFVPQLGDGRAILLGEVVDRQGVRRDIQLKGSGPTPFSRRGDGRAALGPVLREYVVSEAMAALGIPTTRALAAVTTGETVLREGFLPGAVLTRVAASHIRVGTFQFFAARQDAEALSLLADHAIERHYPELKGAENPALGLLDAVISRQASLVAQWMGVGFIHGVMNTDNTSVSGETIDYGPCAFMDAYDPMQVFSSIDSFGRYAYANQPRIMQWNLARLAETLLPLMGGDVEAAVRQAEALITEFRSRFEEAHLAVFRRKIGLFSAREEDAPLAAGFLEVMAEASADFTLAFRHLAEAAGPNANEAPLRALFPEPQKLDDWLSRWRQRLEADAANPASRRDAMRKANPLFIPRNHRVEEAIRAGVDGDFEPFHRLVNVLEKPFEEQPENQRYAEPPQAEERVTRTFCGT